MLATFFIVLLICFLSTIVFTLGGLHYVNPVFVLRENRYLKLGFSFFFGLSLFLFIYRILSYVSGNARLSCLFALLILMSAAALVVKKTYGKPLGISVKKMIVFCLLSTLLFLFLLAFWLVPLPECMSPWDFLGSLHSGRYANIATYVVSTNSVPVINQNYGQSLLSTIPMFFGVNRPFLSLFVWLFISLIFLAVLFYGFLRFLGVDEKFSLWGVLVLMGGNTALSFTHVFVFDSISPLLLTGYSDTVASVGTFLGALVVLYEACFGSNSSRSAKLFSLFILSVLGASWSIYAPQNVVLMFVVMFFILGAGFFMERRLNKAALFFVFYVVFSFLGVLFGGMLTPKNLLSDVDIPGALVVSPKGFSLNFAPFLPCQRITASRDSGMTSCSDMYSSQYGYTKDNRNLGGIFLGVDAPRKIAELLFILETLFWDSIRIVFFPLLGLCLLWYQLRVLRLRDYVLLRALFSVSVLLFSVGFLIAYPFILNGEFKWELSRFMIPGYTLSMVSLVVSLNRFYLLLEGFKAKLLLASISLLLFFGPAYNSVFIVYKNVVGSGGFDSFAGRVEALLTFSGIVHGSEEGLNECNWREGVVSLGFGNSTGSGVADYILNV